MNTNNIYAIALTTFRESIRSKILYVVLFFAIGVVLLSALFGTVTIGDQIRVIKDFGLMSISLFTIAYAVIAGAALLFKELSKKTIYNILAKPVYRSHFLLGKYFGMLATSVLMISIMGTGLLVFAAFFEGKFDWLLVQGYFFALLELVIICAAAIFFSTIVVTPLLSGLFTFGIFICGRSTEYLLYFINEKKVDGLAAHLLGSIYAILPHLDEINIANSVVYGESVSLSTMATSTLYCVSYAAVLLILANFLFLKKEFN